MFHSTGGPKPFDEDTPVYGNGRIAWKKRLERWKLRQGNIHKTKGERGGNINDGNEGPNSPL